MSYHLVPQRPHWLAFKGASAQSLLDALRIAAPPVDPVAIARFLGVEVLAAASPPWDGAVTSSPDGNATIMFAASHSPTRQRFTVAHELGHLLLHPTGESFRDGVSGLGTNLHEIAANRFAAHLLMPASLVEAYLRVVPPSRLPSIFGVSQEAMNYRLKNLGIAVT